LIDAARLLARRGTRVRAVIAGDGPLTAALKSRAEGLENVVFLGNRTRPEVAALLHLSDLFVQPSVDLPGQREGTPTAVIEAMAAGLPVVGTSIGGTPGLLGGGDGGPVVPPGDPVALADAIEGIVRMPLAREAMGARNRRIAAQYDWGVVADEVLSLYQRARESRS
jgi:glycosyltransferase involved in cell wall biosynthesis